MGTDESVEKEGAYAHTTTITTTTLTHRSCRTRLPSVSSGAVKYRRGKMACVERESVGVGSSIVNEGCATRGQPGVPLTLRFILPHLLVRVVQIHECD